MDGDKVKVTVMFRGREMVHRQIGYDRQLDQVVDLLGPLAAVENPPRMEGRFLSMILRCRGREAAKKAEARGGGRRRPRPNRRRRRSRPP